MEWTCVCVCHGVQSRRWSAFRKMVSRTHSHCGFQFEIEKFHCIHADSDIDVFSLRFFKPNMLCIFVPLARTHTHKHAWCPIEIILRFVFFFFILIFSLFRALLFSSANSTHLLCMAFCVFTAIKCIRRVSHSIGIVSRATSSPLLSVALFWYPTVLRIHFVIVEYIY